MTDLDKQTLSAMLADLVGAMKDSPTDILWHENIAFALCKDLQEALLKVRQHEAMHKKGLLARAEQKHLIDRFWQVASTSPIWRYVWEVTPAEHIYAPQLVGAPTETYALRAYGQKYGEKPISRAIIVGNRGLTAQERKRIAWRLCKQKKRSEMSASELAFVRSTLNTKVAKDAHKKKGTGRNKDAYKEYQREYHRQRRQDDEEWAKAQNERAKAWQKAHSEANAKAVAKWKAADKERAKLYKEVNKLQQRVRYEDSTGVCNAGTQSKLAKAKDVLQAYKDSKRDILHKKTLQQAKLIIKFLEDTGKEQRLIDCAHAAGITSQQMTTTLAAATFLDKRLYETDDKKLGLNMEMQR